MLSKLKNAVTISRKISKVSDMDSPEELQKLEDVNLNDELTSYDIYDGRYNIITYDLDDYTHVVIHEVDDEILCTEIISPIITQQLGSLKRVNKELNYS